MVNTKNTASNTVSKENYDLMTLVVIKLGNTVYNGDEEDEGYELLRFLNTIMYPHKDDFMDMVSEYIDFSDNEALHKEVIHVSTIEQIKYEGMREELTGRGIEVLILNNLAEQIPKERTLINLQKYYNLTEEKAMQYYDKLMKDGK